RSQTRQGRDDTIVTSRKAQVASRFQDDLRSCRLAHLRTCDCKIAPVVIKASSGKAIDALVADLASDAAVKRDAAVARLTVIGARAVERLIALATNVSATSSARVA